MGHSDFGNQIKNGNFLSDGTSELYTFNVAGIGNSGNWSTGSINGAVTIRFGSSANPITGDDDVKYYFEYNILDFAAIT